MKVSVLLLTHNEQINLGACLEALSWCDDVCIIDSGSVDGTLDIARAHGARVLHRPFDDFARQRNFGLAEGNLRHDWVLHLDADEVVTAEFKEALDALTPGEAIDGYRVPSKLMLFGHWLKNAGMYPAYQVRLGHRNRLRFKQVGHGQREMSPPERIGLFAEPYLHYSFSHGMRAWLVKHVRYAADEANLIAEMQSGLHEETGTAVSGPMQRRRAAKRLAARLPPVLRPVARFAYVYLFRRGFMDGRSGLAYAIMLSVYEGMIAAFLYERRLTRKTNGIQNTADLAGS
jgi:hypothetical protein